MTLEPPHSSSADQTLERHRAYAEVLRGERHMAWSDWAMFIYDSTCLTPDGQRVALQAVDTLQHTLKDDFFQRVTDWLARRRATGGAHQASNLHPVLSLGFWPANDVSWVYANLIQLATHIQLFKPEISHNKLGLVLKMLRDNLEPVNWVSALLQFEVAGLGQRAGWASQFEPDLGTGNVSDVSLTNGVAQLLVETTTLSMSDSERKAQASFRSLSWQLHQLEWQYSVRISGSLGSAQFSSPEEIARWLQDIDKAAHSTAQDGISRPVPGPNEGQLTIFRPTEATAGESWEVVGAPVEARIIDRLIAKLRYKNKQAE